MALSLLAMNVSISKNPKKNYIIAGMGNGSIYFWERGKCVKHWLVTLAQFLLFANEAIPTRLSVETNQERLFFGATLLQKRNK